MTSVRWVEPPGSYASFHLWKLRAFAAIFVLGMLVIISFTFRDAKDEGMMIGLAALPAMGIALWALTNYLARRLDELTITTDFKSGVVFVSSSGASVLTLDELAAKAEVIGAAIQVKTLGVTISPFHTAAARLRREIEIRQHRFGPDEQRREKLLQWSVAACAGIVFGGIAVAALFLEWRELSMTWNSVRVVAALVCLTVAAVATAKVLGLRSSSFLPPN